MLVQIRRYPVAVTPRVAILRQDLSCGTSQPSEPANDRVYVHLSWKRWKKMFEKGCMRNLGRVANRRSNAVGSGRVKARAMYADKSGAGGQHKEHDTKKAAKTTHKWMDNIYSR